MTYGLKVYSKAVASSERLFKFSADSYTGDPYRVDEYELWDQWCTRYPFLPDVWRQDSIQSPYPYVGAWPAWWYDCAVSSGVLDAIDNDPDVFSRVITSEYYPVWIDPLTMTVYTSQILFVDSWAGGSVDSYSFIDSGALYRGGKPIFSTEQTSWSLIDAIKVFIPSHRPGDPVHFFERSYAGTQYAELKVSWHSPLKSCKAVFEVDQAELINKVLKVYHIYAAVDYFCDQPGELHLMVWGRK